MSKRERGLHELYSLDPESADYALWGRRSDRLSRRGFLHKSGLMAMGAALGASIPLWRRMPAGLIPAALADTAAPIQLAGKDPGLLVINDRPTNAETPAHLLDDPITPADKLFVRNNGIVPPSIDVNAWTLTIDGEAAGASRTFSLAELKSKFKAYTYQLQLECAGNGRSEFYPPAHGNQWTTGAVGCPEWTGVRLRDVLEAVGVKKNAVYIGYYSADTHPSGEAGKVVISRGVPMAKAMENETLIAWAINGQDLPVHNGHPLRLVCGGWPGSVSGKWLTRIAIRDRVHDGAQMSGGSYQLPCDPIAPGESADDKQMCIIESMPVKSLITYPKSGIVHERAKPLTVRGHAWAGDRAVKEVHVSMDFGQTWTKCAVKPPKNRLAWQRFQTDLRFARSGYYEIWARAVDDRGISQPMVVPGWNPKGYLNNACHRIAVRVG